MAFKKILIILPIIIFLSFFLFDFSLAQRELEVPIPGLKTTKIPALPDYITAIYNFALMIIGIICFGALVYGGFLYLTSAGNPARIKEAKDQIFSAILGLIILFSAYLILRTINPELVILYQEPPQTFGCTKKEDCPVKTDCESNKCKYCKDEVCQYVLHPCNTVNDCPDLECIKGENQATGICSVTTSESWASGCSSYLTSDDCTKAHCKWCPTCSGCCVNAWGVDKCVNPDEDCGYTPDTPGERCNNCGAGTECEGATCGCAPLGP
jgi:hypothetical protein